MAGIQRKRRMPLQYKIMLLAAGLIALVLILVGSLVAHKVIRQVEDECGVRAMEIGRLVAQDPVVQAAIVSDNPSAFLQPYAERWRHITGAAFIVIANMEQIRLSHTIPGNVGTPLTDLYREPVLLGQEFVYVGKGSLATSLRANVPVWDLRQPQIQIGFISVGFYLSEMYQQVFREVRDIVFVLLAALVCGLVGAAWLARNVKKAILGLEPYEIARLLQEHIVTLEAIQEGVVTVDANGMVRLMNGAAGAILGIKPEAALGKSIAELIPFDEMALPQNGSKLYNTEYQVNGIAILAHSVPISLDGEDIGAVILFRDRTEARRLAEEISGVHKFIDGLRAQAHEYKNKLHAIAGLIQLGRNEEAVDFITDSSGIVQEIFERLQTRIKDPVTFALLVGKSSRARELGIDYQIDPASEMRNTADFCIGGDMVLILGNLIENAMEAVASLPNRQITVGVYDEIDKILVKVANSGLGIDPDLGERIYERGVTTKVGARGYGLALVASKLSELGGSIHYVNLPGTGVEFVVSIPIGGGQEKK